MNPSSTFPPDKIEAIRQTAEKLLRDRYNNNQSALARDLDIRPTNIHRFVVKKKGGVSSRTAARIEALVQSKPPKTPPVAVVNPRQKQQPSDELDKVLAFFDDRWPIEVQQLARMLVEHRGIKLDKTAWIEKLDAIESCVDDLVKNITK